MKCAWTKSWQFTNALAAVLLAASVVAAGGENRANELTLARLRPGQDTLAAVTSLYGKNHRRVMPDSNDVLAWVDRRRDRVLRIELRDDNRIESVTLAAAKFLREESGEGPEASLPPARMITGRGLAIGEPVLRVLRVYGEPATRGPAMLHGREVEFLYYAFDWAGSDVPQVMEVTCDRATRRVIKITLAASSL